jgi:Na+-driven multidrug efflux pump
MFEINFMVVVAITNTMLETYGDALALAAIAVVSSCVTFLYMPATGLDEGMQPVIGYNFGAGIAKRVRHIILWALGTGGAFFIISFLIIQFGAENVVSLFVDDNPLFEQMAARALRITFAVAPLMAFMIVIPGILSALGEVRYNFVLSIGIQLCVQIPALFILPRFFGVDGIWLSFPLVDIVSSVLGLILLLKSLKSHGLLPQNS